jgi:hypothetical protein
MLIYTPDHFKISEFLPKEIFNLKDVNHFWFMNPKIIWTADQIRLRYRKPVYINTWAFAGMGNFNNRGYRIPDCKIGAPLSQHKFGNAIDFNVEDTPAIEVQRDIEKNCFLECYQYITCLEIEDGVEKTHIDCRPHNKQKFGLLILKKRSNV